MKIGYINQQRIDDSNLKIIGAKHFEFNSIVKNALLVTLAGYLEKDKILVSGKSYYQSEKLSRFFSYILNDKRAAPRRFKLKIKFVEDLCKPSPIIKNGYDCIVAFSGGIDSTAGILYALDKKLTVKPIWLGFGQKNEKRELKVIRNICKQLNLKPLIIRIDLKKYVDEGWSRWKMGIIPARNYLFASIASSIAAQSTKKATKIYICAHKEEVNPVNTDKSMRFFKTCTAIFTKAYKKNVELTSPFLQVTKPEILSFWVSSWNKRYQISPYDTVSCYYGNNCGNCKACINRAVAFSCAGLRIEGFETNPFFDKEKTIGDGYLTRFDSLKLERKLDFLYAMKMNRENLSEELKSFFDTKWPRYKTKVATRLKEIKRKEI